MDFYKVIDVIEKPITGEWGEEGSGVKVLRTTNFTNSGEINYSDVVERNIDFKKISQKKLKIGDTILEKSGGSPTQPVGRVVYFDKESNENYLCNNFTTILRPKVNVFSKYLFWNLFYNHIIKKTISFQNKTTGIINLQTERYLKETKIPLPPLATQKAIAEKLDKADALRKKDQELLKQYDELAQSIFIDMFGDPVHNEKGWDLINFEEVLKLKRGYDLPVQDRNQNGNIPVYGSNGILDYHTISKTNKPCIVTGRSGTIGKVHRTEQNCWPLNTTLYSYEIYDNNITYLEYLLNNLKIDRFAHGAGVPTLDRKIVHKEFIPNIKVELQNQFAEKIKNIEAQKELVKKQAEASENLFQALLQESFSFT